MKTLSALVLTAALAAANGAAAAPAVPYVDFMRACMESGGSAGWIATGGGGPFNVYINPAAPAMVTVSLYTEISNVGTARVRWFNPATNQEVIQPLSVLEQLTVSSKNVRYEVQGSMSPTYVCSRVR